MKKNNTASDLEEGNTGRDDSAKLTGSGCVLALISFAVILVVAVPIVQWRDAATGEPLPRSVAIITPLLIGAAFHGTGTVLLRLVGLPIWSQSETDESRSQQPKP